MISKMLSSVTLSLVSLSTVAAVGDNLLHLDLASSVKHITVDEQRSRVFIPDTDANAVRVVDLVNLTEMSSLGLNAPAHDVAIAEDAKQIFVTLGDSPVVAVFDADSLDRLADIVLPELGYEVVTDDQYLYISAYGSYNGVMRIDLNTQQYVDTFKSSLFAYYRAMLALSPDNSKLYVANSGVSPLSLGVFDITGTVPSLILKNDSGVLGSNGGSLSVDPINGHYVSVAAAGGNTAGYDTYVLSAENLSVVSQLNTEAFPRTVAYSQDGKSIYTAHESESILKWDAETATLTQNIAISGQAQVITEAHNQRYLIVANKSNAVDIYEIAVPEPLTPKLNAIVNGVIVQQVVCYNKTTKQKVTFSGDQTHIFDCIAHGLNVTAGDNVRVTIHSEIN